MNHDYEFMPRDGLVKFVEYDTYFSSGPRHRAGNKVDDVCIWHHLLEVLLVCMSVLDSVSSKEWWSAAPQRSSASVLAGACTALA